MNLSMITTSQSSFILTLLQKQEDQVHLYSVKTWLFKTNQYHLEQNDHKKLRKKTEVN